MTLQIKRVFCFCDKLSAHFITKKRFECKYKAYLYWHWPWLCVYQYSYPYIHRVLQKNNLRDKFDLDIAFDTKREFPILSIFICKICMYTGMQGRVTETVRTFNPCDKWSHNINIHDLNIENYTINLKFNMWRNSHHKLSE